MYPLFLAYRILPIWESLISHIFPRYCEIEDTLKKLSDKYIYNTIELKTINLIKYLEKHIRTCISPSLSNS